MRRILSHEYLRSVELILGANAAQAAAPPADLAQEGFDMIGATILPLSTEPIELYELAATLIAEAAIANPSTMAETAPCVSDGEATEACYEQIATNIGRLFLRRPLVQDEIDELVAVASFAEAWAADEPSLDAFEQAVKYELMALLQSPSFIYIPEVGEADEATGHQKLTSLEIASRMSFFLLGRTPDSDLLDIAEADGLQTVDEVREAAMNLLDSDEAWPGLAVFYDELFRLRYLEDGTPKNAEIFPTWSAELGADMRTETLLFLQDVIWKNEGDMRTMFTADYTFVNDALASHYGITPPGDGDTFVKTKWPASQNRAGLISHGSLLAHQSGSLQNSPTKRGKFIMNFILCKVAPPPPDDVIPELPDEPDGGATLQELLDMHMEDTACAGCHVNTDNIGFALEHFDAIGRQRTTDENGEAIDGSGSLDWLGEWENAAELGDALSQFEDLGQCMIKNFIRGRLGHTETKGDKPAVTELSESFAADGYRLRSLLAAFTANQIFRYVGEAK